MLNDHITFRRVTAGTLLVVAPLLQAVAVVVDPGTWGDDREAVSFGDNPALAQTQSALYHWSWMLMAVAVIGLMHLTRRRATRLGHVSGVLAVIGYLQLSGLLLIDPVEWYLGQHNSPEEAQRILDEMLNLPGVIFGFQMPWMFFGFVGLPLLTVAVWRAGFTGWWVPLVVAAGYLGGFLVPYGPLTVPFWVAPVAALGWTGTRILRMGDAAWAEYYQVSRVPESSPR
ncbi:unnamed protein product [[Actinomadura] parvosata subsp. kistnae]|uniref:DUF4386 domain-containing protein n=1 Tax=[Actinomadura] parvosata subsp. kistnae TaxID=1909395 RepID=A0A1V0AAE5_9ACTN|nr:hypothetical protein [Nonomuraea sp. ATCC 55076]AQZ67171.1 hypothetical protein BKM31_42095 [Nonomuraea sp. ATCC 55076]SPL94618.1 unnamed protein product [Actinomadura parvosata subsp. kistnae]